MWTWLLVEAAIAFVLAAGAVTWVRRNLRGGS